MGVFALKTNISTLKTWMGCPLQARFKEIEKRPYKQNAKASFGVCIHEALEQYNNNGDIEAAIERFKETWHNPEILDVVPEVWPKYTDYGKLRAKGIQALELYHEKNKWENRQIIATEHPFCVPIGEHLISGVVDLVEAKRSGRGKRSLRIIDYKCLDVDAPVHLAAGEVVRAGGVSEGDVLIGYDNGTLVPTRVKAVVDNGMQPIYEVITFGGRTLRVTGNHPFLTAGGEWVNADDLIPATNSKSGTGHRLTVGLGWSGTKKPYYSSDECYWFGAMLGDGSMASGISFCSTTPEIYDRVSYITTSGFEGFNGTFKPVGGGSFSIGGLRGHLDHIGLLGCRSRTKFVPVDIMSGSPDGWKAFLAGYLDTDGSVRTEPSGVISWHSVNRDMLDSCMTLLGYLGVVGRLEKINSVTKEGYSFRLTVSDQYGVSELSRLLLPYCYHPMKKERMAELAKNYPLRPVGYGTDAVKSVEIVDENATVGIEVDGSHTHLTGGVITHNTNSKAPTTMQLRMDIQFSAYTYASLQPEFWLGNTEAGAKYVSIVDGEMYFEAFQNVDRRAVWYDMWNNKEKDAGPRDDADFLRLYRCIKEVANAIDKEVFVPNISGDTCHWCDYTDLCTAVGPIRDIMGEPIGGDDDEGMF